MSSQYVLQGQKWTKKAGLGWGRGQRSYEDLLGHKDLHATSCVRFRIKVGGLGASINGVLKLQGSIATQVISKIPK